MAQGNEVIFLLTEAELETVTPHTELLSIRANFEQGSDGYNYELAGAAQRQVGSELARIHTRLLARFGAVAVHPPSIGGGAQAVVTMPGGRVQRFEPFRVGMFGTDGGPFCFGISLWSRYWPTWLDWEHPHGGSGADFTIAKETLGLIEEARAGIAEVLPFAAGAKIAVVWQSY